VDWDKIPSTKHQIPNKFQVSNSNVLNESHFKLLFFVWVIGSLEFGAYLKFGAWKLVL
jgi:hypothetical protein